MPRPEQVRTLLNPRQSCDVRLKGLSDRLEQAQKAGSSKLSEETQSLLQDIDKTQDELRRVTSERDVLASRVEEYDKR